MRLLLLAALLLAPLAQAHMGEENPPTGILTVPARGSAAVELELFHPQDRLEWVSTVEGSAQVTSKLVWTDAAGASHTVASGPDARTYGRFEAPADLRSGQLVWENPSDAPATVTWTYQTSAEFWTRPEMMLPAVLPFVLLFGALGAGKLLDAHFKRRRARAGQERGP